MVNFKKFRFRQNVFVLVLVALTVFSGCKSESEADKILSQMTLQQKAQIVVGTRPPRGNNPEGEQAELDAYAQMAQTVGGYLPGAAGFTSEFPEIGITAMVLPDGPAGVRVSPTREGEDRTYYCTAFPIATVMASTWDTDLVEQVGQAMGNEVLEYGADILLAPGMNLQRDPLCGRNFEYYSEDPLITGKMAAAMVRGVQSNGVGTAIKHYAVNNQETNRHTVDAIVSQRALRELYLRGFEIAVKEGEPWTVMSSYNLMNGPYTAQNYGLLTQVLRDDWGFEGFVMTDWGGGDDPIEQMRAGNDLIMPGSQRQIDTIIAAVNAGILDQAYVDLNVSRILNVMLKSPRHKAYAYSNNPDLVAHAQVTRQAATDGMVLLKNSNDALPISSAVTSNIAAFGNTSYDFISGGTGSGDVNEAYTISLEQGIAEAGFETDAELTDIYSSYITEAREAQNQEGQGGFGFRRRGPVPEFDLGKDIIARMAQQADVALITIGRNAGEGRDRQAEPGDFYLTDIEKNLIQNVTDAFHAQGKKSVVVLNIGGAVETASWRDIPDAILLAWQPGQEGGNSVMDILTGKVNPSGKLAVSFPVVYDDVPSSDNFPGEMIPQEEGVEGRQVPNMEVIYEEDIYVGYRYYNTFDVPVAYEFGYGMSYTTFEYSNLQLSTDDFDGEVTVSVDVTNTGDVAGREVVQVYSSAPDGKLEKPQDVLVAFDKTQLLQPGASETLSFTITSKELASFDTETSSFIVEAGDYTLKVGASSKDIKLDADMTVGSDMVVETVSDVLAPPIAIDVLTK